MTGQGGDGPPDLPRGFGRPNPACGTCGDERGGPHGHLTAECQYRDGMSVGEVAELPHLAGRKPEFWNHYVELYLADRATRRRPTTVTAANILKETR